MYFGIFTLYTVYMISFQEIFNAEDMISGGIVTIYSSSGCSNKLQCFFCGSAGNHKVRVQYY